MIIVSFLHNADEKLDTIRKGSRDYGAVLSYAQQWSAIKSHTSSKPVNKKS